jgi:branched-chain amino acid aminotransferase
MSTRASLPDWNDLRFAFTTTDVMYRCEGQKDRDPVWGPGEYLPFGEIALSPAASVLSYGLGVFEGLKARRTADGRVLLFRPAENARRFRRSAERLLLEPFPERRFVEVIAEVVRRNLRFVPPHGRGSFYVRPLEHALEERLGIREGRQFQLLVYGTPVGGYFAGQAGDPRSAGLRLRVVDQGRCAAGGTGAAKAIGNYAGGIAVAWAARQHGFDDVLYLDARHLRYLTETSGSNVFVKLRNGRLVTPALDDQILAGVTRDSVIRIAREVLGLVVEERAVGVEEALEDAEELFCTGTAYTVVGARELDYRGRIHRFDSRDVQRAILSEVRAIQRGECEDRFDWTLEIADGG